MKYPTIFILILLFPAVSFSATLLVPQDHLTIQGAIDAAQTNDTVLVDPGTYVENIDFKGKAIAIRSTGGYAVTVIDGGHPVDPDFGSVVLFANQEGQDTVLDGFTLENGSGTAMDARTCGGGIFCHGASPSIINNLIHNNTVEGESLNWGYGGGISCYAASPTIENNIIYNNCVEQYGGGIDCSAASAPTIVANLIKDNMVEVEHPYEFGLGGGIHIHESFPIIKDNTITGNKVPGIGASGGGIFSALSDLIVTNNHIFGNTSGDGGGITAGLGLIQV